MSGPEKKHPVRLTSATRSSELFPNFFAAALILLAPIIHFIAFHQYSFLNAEVLWLFGGLMAIGIVASILMSSGNSLIKLLVVAFLLTYFCDVQFEISQPYHLDLIFLAILAGSWVVRGHVTTIVTTVFVVFVVSTLAFPDTGEEVTTEHRETDQQNPDSELPPILHLILDEHIGIEGIPVDVESGSELKSELLDLYTSNDFRLYGRAFSQYYDTHNAIPNTLNFSSQRTDAYYFGEKRREIYSLKENAYFDRLSDLGYRIHIYQSSYLDFCDMPDASIASCTTYASNSIKSIERLQISTSDKLKFILNSISDLSTGFRYLQTNYSNFRESSGSLRENLPSWERGADRVGPLPTLPVFIKLAEDIAENPAGSAFVAHLNIPHYPYVLDSECRVIDDVDEWHFRKLIGPVRDGVNNPDSRAQLYIRYFGQIRCLNRKVSELIDVLRSTGSYENATIIVQGDHGSRITLIDPLLGNEGKLVDTDYLDGFSTIFAVKAPGVAPGYDRSVATIQDLLAFSLGKSDSVNETDHVYLWDELHKELSPHRMDPFTEVPSSEMH